jgi:glucosylceramidase
MEQQMTKRISQNNSDGSSFKGGGINRREFLKRSTAVAVSSSACMMAAPDLLAAQTELPAGVSATLISTTQNSSWKPQPLRAPGWQWDTLNVVIDPKGVGPALEGFGACFNELGWTSLQKLSSADRESILQEMFQPGRGANFTICRMPVGANDFSRGWYSYDETADDFSMQHFSIANDLETLIPFIHNAQRYNPALRLWASPWSPPTWMKRNKHYAEAEQRPGSGWPSNGIRPDQVGTEGTDMFIQEDWYFKAYALYFGKFIDAYRQQGIPVGMVMPQNEFNSAQAFPSCTWMPQGLAHFIRHLGPVMDQRSVSIFFGTLERGDPQLLEQVMADPEAGRWIKGVGIQWTGKNAIRAIHEKYPSLTIYQSEQECGDGRNDWSYAGYCWDLMKHYFMDGATGYMYWNLSLETGGVGHWGWPQNSLVTVDAANKTYRFNHEYYVLKHVSGFVRTGAQRLETDGTFDDLLAFRNTDGSIAVILRNESARERSIDVSIGSVKVPATMPPDSISTLLFHQ